MQPCLIFRIRNQRINADPVPLRRLLNLAAVGVALILMISARPCLAQAERPGIVEGERLPAVAGSFYPTDRDTLRAWVDHFLKSGGVPITGEEVTALIAPHAGYQFSGWVAGEAYRQIVGRKYDAAIILSPSHYRYFKGSSIYAGTGYRTPLGTVKVDQDLAAAMADVDSTVRRSWVGHEWTPESREHALEVQLPFLQVVQPGLPVVPVVMGSQDFRSADGLMKAVVAGIRRTGKRVLLIASSDLSHFHASDTARALDSSLISALARYDYHTFGIRLFGKEWEACGGGPVLTAMMSAEILGSGRMVPLRYMNSGDVAAGAGRRDRVVGYMAGLILRGTSQLALPRLDAGDSAALKGLAERYVRQAVLHDPAEKEPGTGEMPGEYPVFVTLTKQGKLRGCIGYIIPTGPISESVGAAATLAATRDRRFTPVIPDELSEITYEVTILSRMQRVLDTAQIVPGRDGIYLRLHDATGIFLPQVATENGWDRTTFLEQIGLKAGLSRRAYLERDAELYRFEALVVH